MSTATALQGIGRQLDDPASLGRAVDELLAGRTEPPLLFALGEPTHGVEAFPRLRNDLLRHLVERGYRSITLETDVFKASVVDDYIGGADGEIDPGIETVLATGFSHGFGTVPGNRELVAWLRAHNAGRDPQDQVRFYGFDAPVEFSGAPSPRTALRSLLAYLPDSVRPDSNFDLDGLVGEDADWSNPAAMYDPAASIGNADRARALRIVADDLASVLRRAAAGLAAVDPTRFTLAQAHARTAQGLLRYHAAMATPAADRIDVLLSLRTEMIAENLLAVVEQERHRGPGLVFAHNVHLQGRPPQQREISWGSAGALVQLELGARYLVVATDANPNSAAGTLQGLLAAATQRRALFPVSALRAALPSAIGVSEPMVRGHLPLQQAELDRADAVIFISETDGQQHQYW